MKRYQQPIITVTLFETDDIITSSQDDNVGGIPGGWGGVTNN